MYSVQHAKISQLPPPIPPRLPSDGGDSADACSDTESVPGSVASQSVMDDDLLESLMHDVADDDGSEEEEKWMAKPLPARLSYLQQYVGGATDTQTDNDHTSAADSVVENSAILYVDSQTTTHVAAHSASLARDKYTTGSTTESHDQTGQEAGMLAEPDAQWVMCTPKKKAESQETKSYSNSSDSSNLTDDDDEDIDKYFNTRL